MKSLLFVGILSSLLGCGIGMYLWDNTVTKSWRLKYADTCMKLGAAYAELSGVTFPELERDASRERRIEYCKDRIAELKSKLQDNS